LLGHLGDGEEEALDQGIGGRHRRTGAGAGLAEQRQQRVRRLKGAVGLRTARTGEDVLSEQVGGLLGQ
jgi:hypothetical protein